jgi:hypothetical protein
MFGHDDIDAPSESPASNEAEAVPKHLLKEGTDTGEPARIAYGDGKRSTLAVTVNPG